MHLRSREIKNMIIRYKNYLLGDTHVCIVNYIANREAMKILLNVKHSIAIVDICKVRSCWLSICVVETIVWSTSWEKCVIQSVNIASVLIFYVRTHFYPFSKAWPVIYFNPYNNGNQNLVCYFKNQMPKKNKSNYGIHSSSHCKFWTVLEDPSW